MKKRNKHYLKEKEFIRLKKALEENNTAQFNLGWVELDNPIFIGYNAYLEPRPDIQNRDDAWVFWTICQNLGTVSFAKKIEYFDWEKRKSKSFIQYDKPRICAIDESTYLSIDPQIRKWFTNEIEFSDKEYDRWRKWGKSYYCKIPNFFFEIKYEKVFRTRVKIFDSVLKQEEAEIEDILYSKFYYENRRYSNAPKYFRKNLNRSQRYKSKQKLHNVIYNGKDPDFEDNYKGANWLWW
jgi:hypothetical protein